MIDFLLPATDAAVIAQLIAVLAIGSAATVGLRRHRDARLLAIGITVVLVAMMGLRTVH